MTPLAATLAMCAKVELADAALDAANDAADIPWDRVRSPALDHAAEQADEAFTAVARQCAPALAARLRVVMDVWPALVEHALDDVDINGTDGCQEHDAPVKRCHRCSLIAKVRAATAKLEAL